MSTLINDGGPAFPQHLAFSPNGEAVTPGMYFAEGPGMTLRDYFAAKTLGALLSLDLSSESTQWHTRDAARRNVSFERSVADSSYDFADAMIAARRERQNES